MGNKMLEVNVERVFLVHNGKGLKAFADIVVNDSLLIKGFRVVEGKTGTLFVSMPREKSKDGRWYENVRCLNHALRDQISSEILKMYNTQA